MVTKKLFSFCGMSFFTFSFFYLYRAFISSFRYFEIFQADINLPSKKISFILIAILEIRYSCAVIKIPVKNFQTPSLRHLSNNRLSER